MWSDTVYEFLLHSFTNKRKADEFKNKKAKNRTGIIQTGPRRAAQVSSIKKDSLRVKIAYLCALKAQIQYFGTCENIDEISGNQAREYNSEIFIVHGHDVAIKESVKGFVKKLGLEPIILNEQADLSQTIIEKFEKHSSTPGYAIVLFSPDDEGRSKKPNPDGSEQSLQNRPRQNVVLELGFFIGKLGRDRICVIRSGETEDPSDFGGVLYTLYDSANGWQVNLAKNLKAVGYDFDAEAVFR